MTECSRTKCKLQDILYGKKSDKVCAIKQRLLSALWYLLCFVTGIEYKEHSFILR